MNSKYELLYGNTNKVLKINASQGEKYIVESGALVAMSNVFEIKSKNSSLSKALERFFPSESPSLQKFIAKKQGELLLAPSYLGDIEIIDMDGSKNYKLGEANFLASTSEIEIKVKSTVVDGTKNKEELIQMEATGRGTLFISAYGAIHKKFLAEDEEYIVDTNHIVLWDSRMTYNIQIEEAICSKPFLREGIVCKFKGPGEIWIQTRNSANILERQENIE